MGCAVLVIRIINAFWVTLICDFGVGTLCVYFRGFYNLGWDSWGFVGDMFGQMVWCFWVGLGVLVFSCGRCCGVYVNFDTPKVVYLLKFCLVGIDTRLVLW